MLTSLTIWLNGATAARIAIRMPKVTVMITGAPVRGLTLANRGGIKPSRAIEKKMRVCP